MRKLAVSFRPHVRTMCSNSVRLDASLKVALVGLQQARAAAQRRPPLEAHTGPPQLRLHERAAAGRLVRVDVEGTLEQCRVRRLHQSRCAAAALSSVGERLRRCHRLSGLAAVLSIGRGGADGGDADGHARPDVSARHNRDEGVNMLRETEVVRGRRWPMMSPEAVSGRYARPA
eukprot:2231525-Prymnesium_polylepis.1